MIGTPRFQHGSLIRVKNKTTDDTWFLRFYDLGDHVKSGHTWSG
jgi:hypothetical protein